MNKRRRNKQSTLTDSDQSSLPGLPGFFRGDEENACGEPVATLDRHTRESVTSTASGMVS